MTRSGRIIDEAAEVAFAALVGRHGPMVLRVCSPCRATVRRGRHRLPGDLPALATGRGSIRRADLVSVAWSGCRCGWPPGRARERARTFDVERGEREMISTNLRCHGNDGIPTSDDRDRVPPRGDRPLAREIPCPCGVSCYLRWPDHDQAADQLGRPVGTVRRRSAWATGWCGRVTRRGAPPSSCRLGPLHRGWPGSRPGQRSPHRRRTMLRGRLAGRPVPAFVGIRSCRRYLAWQALQTMTTTKLTLLTATVLDRAHHHRVGLLAYPGQQPGSEQARAGRPKARRGGSRGGGLAAHPGAGRAVGCRSPVARRPAHPLLVPNTTKPQRTQRRRWR